MKKNIKKIHKTQSVFNNVNLTPMNACVGGIDIGAKSVFICIGFTDGHQEVREYLTFTGDWRGIFTIGCRTVALDLSQVAHHNCISQRG